jgi:malate permease and related proteins
VETAMWTLGVAVLTGSGWNGGWKRMLNAPLVALLLALALNFLGMAFTPPAAFTTIGQMILTMARWLGESAIPLALILIGAVVADHLADARGGRAARVVSVAVLVRLGIMPVFFVLLARYLPCSVELKRVIILQGAMPSAVLPVVLAKHYGGDARTALQVVLGTSVAGLAAIPLWIHFGLRLAGL